MLGIVDGMGGGRLTLEEMFPCCVEFGAGIACEHVVFDIPFETSLFVGYDLFGGSWGWVSHPDIRLCWISMLKGKQHTIRQFWSDAHLAQYSGPPPEAEKHNV